ncbi:phosphate propanoyltransferase, partial [Microbacteriaceae bacterium K1510]|nr:phosphate propanoyltransferase [Microbacteriaceae bacterium K1510]
WNADLYAIPVGVSNRHVHLSPEDVEILFGPGYSLVPERELSQPGQFAAKEKVTLLGPKGFIQGVRILGPARGATQVEISRTDGFQLGVHAPVRLSGDIEGTPGITLIGPSGCVVLAKGVIVAKRHVHMSPVDADRFEVKNGDTIILQTPGD